MTNNQMFETVLGAAVLIVAAVFLYTTYQSAEVKKVDGYVINANFPRTDGLKLGGDVMLNGVKVGSVLSTNLLTAPGPDQYLVNVSMSIMPSVRLPVDTVAMIANESLLGGKYMSLEIGVEEDLVKTDGTGRLTNTQAPMRLDDLIGQLIFSNEKKDKADDKTSDKVTEPVSKTNLDDAVEEDSPSALSRAGAGKSVQPDEAAGVAMP